MGDLHARRPPARRLHDPLGDGHHLHLLRRPVRRPGAGRAGGGCRRPLHGGRQRSRHRLRRDEPDRRRRADRPGRRPRRRPGAGVPLHRHRDQRRAGRTPLDHAEDQGGRRLQSARPLLGRLRAGVQRRRLLPGPAAVAGRRPAGEGPSRRRTGDRAGRRHGRSRHDHPPGDLPGHAGALLDHHLGSQRRRTHRQAAPDVAQLPVSRLGLRPLPRHVTRVRRRLLPQAARRPPRGPDPPVRRPLPAVPGEGRRRSPHLLPVPRLPGRWTGRRADHAVGTGARLSRPPGAGAFPDAGAWAGLQCQTPHPALPPRRPWRAPCILCRPHAPA